MLMDIFKLFEHPTERKIAQSIRFLKSLDDSEPIELAFSGGKDSSVILALSRMAGLNIRPIYKNTTIDPPGNVAFCKSQGCEVIQPKKTFFKLIEENGFPTRRARFCCRHLKEYKVLDRAIIGVRRDESTARKLRYTEPEECRAFGNKGNAKKDRSNVVKQYYPILEWTNEDVKYFIEAYNVPINPYYLDSNGDFDPSKRLGCACCPLQGRKSLQAAFKARPRMVYQYIKRAIVWWNKPREKDISSRLKFGTIYDLFFHNVFCNSYEDYLRKKEELGDVDMKEWLEVYFGIKLP